MGKKNLDETKKAEVKEIQEETPKKDVKYLTPKDIEKRLQLSHGTVSKLLHTKGLTLLRVGRTIRVSEEEFEKFLESYKTHQINI